MLLDNYEGDYDALLEKSGKPTMEVKRLRTFSIEILKAISNIEPKFMKDIFRTKSNAKIRPFNVIFNAR